MKKIRVLLAVLILGSALGYLAINALASSAQPTLAPDTIVRPA